MLPCPPREHPEGLWLGAPEVAQKSSVLVLPAAGHLIGQGQSPRFPGSSASQWCVRQGGRGSAQSRLCAARGDLPQDLHCGRELCHERAPGCDTHGCEDTDRSPDMQAVKSFFFVCIQVQALFQELFVLGSSRRVFQGCCPSRALRT